MTFTANTPVVTIFDLKENPYAKPGIVVAPSQEYGFTWVQYPEFPIPVKEEDWTLVAVHYGNRAPAPDAADLAADRAGL